MSNLLSKKAVLANFSAASWGNRRSDREATDELLTSKQAERNTGLFTKRLLSKTAMKDIRIVKASARSYHNRMTMPWMDDGTRVLPTTLYLDYAKQMEEYRSQFLEAVAKFLKSYPEEVNKARKSLGKLFDAKDYPPVSALQHEFKFETIISPCPTSDGFRDVSGLDSADLSEIKSDLEKRISEQLDSCMKDVGERLAEVVGHMVERLKEYKPANKKRGSKAENTFRDSLVENIKELADLIPAFNVTANQKLADWHKKVVKELCHHNADALRDDDAIRGKVLKSAEQILKDVSAFIA